MDKSEASTSRSTRRPSRRQYDTLLTHMEAHPQMLTGENKESWSIADTRNSWALLTKTLNEHCGNDGAYKTIDKWRKSFADLKNKVKNKARSMKLQSEGSTKVRLTDVEERLIKLLGWGDLAKLQKKHTGKSSDTEQKTETSLLNISNVTGGVDDNFSEKAIKTEDEDREAEQDQTCEESDESDSTENSRDNEGSPSGSEESSRDGTENSFDNDSGAATEYKYAFSRNANTQTDIAPPQGETSRKRKNSSEDHIDEDGNTTIQSFMKSIMSIQTKLHEEQKLQRIELVREAKRFVNAFEKIADRF